MALAAAHRIVSVPATVKGRKKLGSAGATGRAYATCGPETAFGDWGRISTRISSWTQSRLSGRFAGPYQREERLRQLGPGCLTSGAEI